MMAFLCFFGWLAVVTDSCFKAQKDEYKEKAVVNVIIAAMVSGVYFMAIIYFSEVL